MTLNIYTLNTQAAHAEGSLMNQRGKRGLQMWDQAGSAPYLHKVIAEDRQGYFQTYKSAKMVAIGDVSISYTWCQTESQSIFVFPTHQASLVHPKLAQAVGTLVWVKTDRMCAALNQHGHAG